MSYNDGLLYNWYVSMVPFLTITQYLFLTMIQKKIFKFDLKKTPEIISLIWKMLIMLTNTTLYIYKYIFSNFLFFPRISHNFFLLFSLPKFLIDTQKQ